MITTKDRTPAALAFTFYIPILFCLMSIIGGVAFIYTYKKFLRMRIYAGKLFLQVTFIQLALGILFGVSVFYDTPAQQEQAQTALPSTGALFVLNDVEKIIFGVIGFHVSCCYFLYHFFISHNLYVFSKPGNSSKNLDSRIKVYAILTQVISIPFSIMAVVFDQLGLQDIGVYGLSMKSKMQFFFLATLIIIFPFAIFSILYAWVRKCRIDKSLKKEDKYEREIRHDFVTSNSLYLSMFIITWMPYAIVSYAGYHDPDNCACLSGMNTALDIFKVISLNLLCISAFLSSIIRVTRPFILKSIKARKCKQKQITDANQDDVSIRVMLLDSSDSDQSRGRANTELSENMSQHSERPKSPRKKSPPININDILSSSNQAIAPQTFMVDDMQMYSQEIQERMTSSAPKLMVTKKNYPIVENINDPDMSSSAVLSRMKKGQKKPKKCIPKTQYYDILLGLIDYFSKKKKLPASPANDSQAPWVQHYYKSQKNENTTPEADFSEEQISYFREKIDKLITLRKIIYTNYTEDVFNHLLILWGFTNKALEQSFEFKANIKHSPHCYKKSLDHLEQRYFYMTPNKQVILASMEKESKMTFVDQLMPHYHGYMAQNRKSFIVKILGIFSFHMQTAESTADSINVLSVLNPYENYYSGKEKCNLGMPLSIQERYMVDGKNLRQECYEQGVRVKKIKKPMSEKFHKRIFYLKNEVKTEILDLLKKDLEFLSQHNIINYRVVMLISKDPEVLQRLQGTVPNNLEMSSSKSNFGGGGIALLDDGSALKIFIDTPIVTSKMRKFDKKTKNPMFSIENSQVYRQCIEEMISKIL